MAGFLALAPISELRGAIPYFLAKGGHPLAVYLYCVGLNALVGPLVFLFLNSVHRLFSKIPLYNKLFDALVERARSKIEEKVKKYEYWGVTIFVAIPLPITGAWTGSLGAWVLDLQPRRTFLHVFYGVCIAGLVVLLVSYFGIEAFSFFTKSVSP
jgi:uncharacterized membrane protein